MRYIYSMTKGRASDIRPIGKDYVPKDGEYGGQGDKLPSPEELNHPDILKEDRIKEVKFEAGKRIVTLAGVDFKQRNKLARYMKLLGEKVDGGTLSASEVAELTSLKALWFRVEDIRAISNTIEAELNELSDREEILDFDIITNGLWPK